MKFNDAMAAFGDGYSITIKTRSGAEYEVARDTVECYGEEGYVYGFRINGSAGGPFDRREGNGAVRWFALKNVTLVEGV